MNLLPYSQILDSHSLLLSQDSPAINKHGLLFSSPFQFWPNHHHLRQEYSTTHSPTLL